MLMDKLGQQVYLANLPRFADKKAHRIKEKNKDTIKMLLSLTWVDVSHTASFAQATICKKVSCYLNFAMYAVTRACLAVKDRHTSKAFSTISSSSTNIQAINKYVRSEKGESNVRTALEVLRFTVLEFSRELKDYIDILRDRIETDHAQGFGIYTSELLPEYAVINIPNRMGFLIPHIISEVKEDPPTYLDQYLIASKLYAELGES